ncbi:MAG: nicotinate mononucleotide-dependent phosphoribosyltransferase CobT [Thermoplasmata archaeon]
MFILVISNTLVAQIPGITEAGANIELIKYTPVADAEFLFYSKPISIDAIPVTPEGHPTPAIITKAVKNILNFPIIVVRSGTILYPKIPHIFIHERPGENIMENDGLPHIDEILERSELLGMEFSDLFDNVYIAESVPGGTTTSLAVLNSLGYEASVSSSMKNNPINLKRKIVENSLKRKKANSWYESLKYFGDPMMAFIVGFSQGFKKEVYLFGGTQMLAAAALMKETGKMPRKIVTTRYVIEDKTATFSSTAKDIGVEYYASYLDFSDSKHFGLRDYESGMVKEGVGAGGSVYLAEKAGIKWEDIKNKIEEIYENIIKKR